MTVPTSSLLIIDDDAIHLSTLASTLRLRLPDAVIETADSALVSLERIRAHEYDAILCDAHQSGIEGAAFARAVRKLHPQTPVLLLIEKDDEDFINQAMEAGAYDVLARPISEGRLLFALQRAIATHRLRGQVKREEEQLLDTLTDLLKDLEQLYGADGLSAHFAAFMDQVNQDREAARKKNGSSNHGTNGVKAQGGKE
jgi:DNA-binding NtrC family response regulator